MELEKIYAEKAEKFRAAINKQADEEIARRVQEIKERKNAAGKVREEHETAEALAKVRAERSANEMRFKKEISRCEFETTKAVRAHRKELIDGFFEEIRADLVEYTQTKKYEDYIKRALSKAERELGGTLIVFAAAKDVEAVKKWTVHEVRADNSITIGGITAMYEEKGLFADYTLDSALEQEREAFTDKPELRL